MRRFSWLFIGGLLCLFIAFAQGCAKEERSEEAAPGELDGVQTYKRGAEGMSPPQGAKGKNAKRPAGK
jgi:hypothetical protein